MKRWIPRIAVVLAMGWAAVPPAASAPAERRLTLAESIRMAFARNEALVIGRESVAAAAAGIRAAGGAYDPVLAFSGGWSRSTQPIGSTFASDPIAPQSESGNAGASLTQLLPSGGTLSLRADGARTTTRSPLATLSPAYDTRAGFELRQPLLRDRGMDAARLSLRTARADGSAASASLERIRIETAATVEQAYWSLVAARLGVDVHEEAVRLAEQQLRETQSRVEHGTAPRTEIAQPRAELERHRGELLEARETAARAGNALKLLVAGESDDALWAAEIVPTDSAVAEPSSVDVESALHQALVARAELHEATAALDRRRAETAFAREGIWPSLDAVVSYDRYGLAGSRNLLVAAGLPSAYDGDLGSSWQSLRHGNFDATQVALVLGLPLTDRAARGSAAAARAVERQAEAELARVRKTIRAEVLDAAASVETAGQRIAAARSGREAAEVQLAAERDRYASGLSTNFLVLTRQNDLSRARLDEISALTDYRKARAALARATGTPIGENASSDLGR